MKSAQDEQKQIFNMHKKNHISQQITYLLIIAGLFISSAICGQSIQESEQQLAEVQANIKQYQAQLDSLNIILEAQAAAIDREKQRNASDKSNLRRLMADGLELTEEINQQQQALAVLENDRDAITANLATRYTSVLDSLQRLENSGNYAGNRENLRREIIDYTEKYLLFSPSFKALSFDPAEVSSINLSETNDSLERAISADYLEKAIADVDSHLRHIEKNREDLENIVRLEEKTREFLEDIDDEQFGVFTQSADFAATDQVSGNGRDGPVTAEGLSFSSQDQLQSIALFFDQLNIDLTEDELQNLYSPIDSSQATISLAEYLDLLKEAEKRLRQYHDVISDKLEGANSR